MTVSRSLSVFWPKSNSCMWELGVCSVAVSYGIWVLWYDYGNHTMRAPETHLTVQLWYGWATVYTAYLHHTAVYGSYSFGWLFDHSKGVFTRLIFGLCGCYLCEIRSFVLSMTSVTCSKCLPGKLYAQAAITSVCQMNPANVQQKKMGKNLICLIET